MIEVNVENTISKNCQLISQFGSRLGTQFFKPERRSIWQGGDQQFEKEKKAIMSGESNGFILNRCPNKFRIKSFRITGTQIVKDEVTNEIVILVNPDGNGGYALRLPITNELVRAGVVTQEAVAKALKGDDDNFFLNADNLVKFLNNANDAEYRALRELRDNIDKMMQAIQACIAENKQKAEASSREWTDSAVKPDLSSVINRTATGVIVTESSED